MDQRTCRIIKLLIENGSIKTIGAIARQLDVSAKTISRNLTKVDEILAAYDLTLERRTGSGLQLIGSSIKKFSSHKLKTPYFDGSLTSSN